MRPARTADRSAVPIVPNVSVRTGAQHFFLPPSCHDLLGKVLPLPLTSLKTLPLNWKDITLRKWLEFCSPIYTALTLTLSTSVYFWYLLNIATWLVSEQYFQINPSRFLLYFLSTLNITYLYTNVYIVITSW